jgi:hypothetical protein
MTATITSYCSIKKNKVFLDGIIHSAFAEEYPLNDFLNQLYKSINLDYPKYFKMDKLCKLAFITTELLGIDKYVNHLERTKIGVVFSNSVSSLDTDDHYHESIKDRENYFPSPAIFVYTLPNIMIGEICIRHKLMGENAFFVSRIFSPKVFCNYVNTLFDCQRVQSCIIGWVDIDKDIYESFLLLVQHEKTSIGKNIFDENTLLKLYRRE